MITNTNEDERFDSFARFVEAHGKSSYRLIFDDNSVIDCILDGYGESDNCLDIDDPAYEEYWMILFRNLATGKLFEVNYHNMPKEVWCDGNIVDLDSPQST